MGYQTCTFYLPCRDQSSQGQTLRWLDSCTCQTTTCACFGRPIVSRCLGGGVGTDPNKWELGSTIFWKSYYGFFDHPFLLFLPSPSSATFGRSRQATRSIRGLRTRCHYSRTMEDMSSHFKRYFSKYGNEQLVDRSLRSRKPTNLFVFKCSFDAFAMPERNMPLNPVLKISQTRWTTALMKVAS